MMIPTEFLFLGCMVVCAYFSYKAGMNKGHENATNFLLTMFNGMGYIKVATDEEGEIEITQLDEEKTK